MSGTDASTRQAPQRRFENYVLTSAVDSGGGLTNVLNASFTQTSGSAGQGLTDDATSGVTAIGFDFSFDNVTYKQFVVNTNGWIALVDPTLGTFTQTEVLASASYQNPYIKSTFTSQAVLLAPWFDDLKNVASQTTQLLGSPFNYTQTKVDRINAGLESPTNFVNPSSYGVSYFNDVRSKKGRRLIVRWSSISNHALPTSVIKFEAVIYENGAIEFRYAPRNYVALPPAGQRSEGATVGIFMPNGSNRFRDFSDNMGYRLGSRQRFLYGGFVFDAAYTDVGVTGSEEDGVSAPFTHNLVPFFNWPGLASAGRVLNFTPPAGRRRVLPRKQTRLSDATLNIPLVARTGDSRLGRTLSSFDDRKSPCFAQAGSTSIMVNYPTTLPRFFGGDGLGTLERQDLFAGDFLVTASVVRSAIEQFVNEQPATSIDAFNESARYEQDPGTLSSVFFTTGSSPGLVSSGFDQRLKSKTHIRISLPVNYNVQMPSASSSIYYYNSRARTWEVPVNSTYTILSGASVPPSPNPSAGGDWADPTIDATRGRIIEDARGFGPIGNIVSSGSHAPVGQGDQTDAVIGSTYVAQSQADVFGKEYPKSVRNNEQYRPVAEETFTLPINAPFLIEKAVFEIPIAAGAGWFADRTQCFLPIGGSSFDFAGPAMTVALHRNIQLAENESFPSRRDLILTGTIIPSTDNFAGVEVKNFPPYDSTYQVRPVGFLAYANPPGGVVTPDGAQQFTGSVVVEATSLSAVGSVLKFVQQFVSSSGPTNAAGVKTLLTSLPTLNLSNNVSQSVSIASVSPIGRGGTGFSQAGRCILGNEYATLQGFTDQSGLTAANPLYVGQSGLTAQQLAALSTGGSFNANVVAAVSMTSHFPSPYLVMPGDRLVLSISKMRPFMYAGATGTPEFSGSLQHDVQLTQGNINVTLYGSQVQAGVEYHDTLNQPLGSDTVHELIGAEPVLDSFDVAYRHEHSGSFTDNVMLGTLQTLTIGTTKVQSTRDRKFSKLNARNAPKLTTNVTDIMITPSKAARTVEGYEIAGSVRNTQHIDSTERFWDSMMPGVADCFAADGSGIFITQQGTFGNSLQVDTGVSGSLAFNPRTTRTGWIWMDYALPSLLHGLFGSYGPLINQNWNKAFPFEPRYQNASRQINLAKSLVATYLYGGSPSVQSIPPTEVNGFIFGTVELGTSLFNINAPPFVFSSTTPNVPCFDWFADSNLSAQNVFGYYATGSATIDDTARALFGFGDRNTYFKYTDGYFNDTGGVTITTTLLGTNHFPDSRDSEGPHPDGFNILTDNNFYRYSPKIRGWKYGVYSGLPTNSKCYWRRGRFGQFRDMLEQRAFTKYFQTSDINGKSTINFQQGVQPAVVTVNFIDPSGRLTAPDNTWSSNLHFECTSSLPFFDGVPLNRPVPNKSILNHNIIAFKQNAFGNVTL